MHTRCKEIAEAVSDKGSQAHSTGRTGLGCTAEVDSWAGLDSASTTFQKLASLPAHSCTHPRDQCMRRKKGAVYNTMLAGSIDRSSRVHQLTPPPATCLFVCLHADSLPATSLSPSVASCMPSLSSPRCRAGPETKMPLDCKTSQQQQQQVDNSNEKLLQRAAACSLHLPPTQHKLPG